MSSDTQNETTRASRSGAVRRPQSSEPAAYAGPVNRIVAASVAAGAVVALVLVLVVFAGGTESMVTGSALISSCTRRASCPLARVTISSPSQTAAGWPAVAIQ